MYCAVAYPPEYWLYHFIRSPLSPPLPQSLMGVTFKVRMTCLTGDASESVKDARVFQVRGAAGRWAPSTSSRSGVPGDSRTSPNAYPYGGNCKL